MKPEIRARPGALLQQLGLTLIMLATDPLSAKLVQSQIRVPVQVVDRMGRPVEHRIVVTLFRDDAAPKPYPLLVLNHGRSPRAAEREGMGRARFLAASTWLTEFGFMVAVPTRVGYGVSAGVDVEDSGPCEQKNYPPVYQASVVQTLEVLAILRRRPDVAKDNAVIMGQSFGGTTAIAAAARNGSGIRAAINFAGGGGGNPQTRPRKPCAPKAMQQLFGDYGKTSRIPTLWIYTENDLYFGRELPAQWFAAFQGSGGTGEFVLFPPHGDNGHSLFTNAPEIWQPRVRQFLQRLGYTQHQ